MQSRDTTLPAEVLGEIFKCNAPDVPDRDARNYLLIIQLVCKEWKRASDLAHGLWNHLVLDGDLGEKPTPERLEAWFQRAGTLPKTLEVAIPMYDEDDEDDQEAYTSFVKALARFLGGGAVLVEKCEIICGSLACFVRLTTALERESAASYRPTPWESLKIFHLDFSIPGESDESLEPLETMFTKLPPNIDSLELSLRDSFEEQDPCPEERCHFPPTLFNKLSSIKFICYWGGGLYLQRVLEHCVNVKTLTLDFDDKVYETPTGTYLQSESVRQSPILLPNVRKLCLTAGLGNAAKALEFLNAPNLAELDFDFGEPDDESGGNGGRVLDPKLAEYIPKFIARSGCEGTLTHFTVRNVKIKAGELLSTFMGLPASTHITLENVAVDEARIAASGRKIEWK
ncbi:hypothetical protein MD484_g4449, partial [Candolleomyces efflorescens]